MATIRIVSIDPGGDTGWMQHTMYSKGKPIGPFKGGCFMEDDHHLELEYMLEVYEPHVIVYERFNYQVREISKGVINPDIDITAREYIGVIKLYAQRRNAKYPEAPTKQVMLVARNPGQEFKVWTDEKLQKLNMWTTGSRKTNGAPHTNDAMRHLLGVLYGSLNRKDYLTALKPNRKS